MNAPKDGSAEIVALRLLRWTVVGILAVVVALILTQALAALAEPVHQAMSSAVFGFWSASNHDVMVAEWKLGLIALGFAAVVLVLVWRFRLGSWGRIGLGAAAVAAVLSYLAHDDPVIRHPVTVDEFSPSFPGAEKSFGVLMRYGKQQALAKAFKAPTFKAPYPVLVPNDHAKWKATILLHRAEIESNWRSLAVERAWWSELNGFDRIGDLTAPSFDSDIVSFQVFRTLSQHAEAVAGLEAIDGNGDLAVGTILPYLQVARKLQPSSRTLVRTMISVVIERTCLETIGFILDTTSVSPAARAQLEGALQGGDAAQGARHLVGEDSVLSMNATKAFHANDFLAIREAGPGRSGLAYLLRLWGPFVYNPRATFNEATELSTQMQDIAGSRQLAKLDPQLIDFFGADTGRTFKNPLGRIFLMQVTPAVEKVAENYWKTADQRVALIARLKEG